MQHSTASVSIGAPTRGSLKAVGDTVPKHRRAIAALAHSMHTVDYLKSLYRHGKTIVASSEDHPLLEQAGISPRLPNGDPDPGIVWLKGEVEGAMESIAAAVTRRQHPEREQAFAPGA